MHIAYLHGFASGPGSIKGQYFKRRLAEFRVTLMLPDLTDGDFTTMTVTRALDVVDQLGGSDSGTPLVLIGSSFGGYVAALYAARRPDRVAHLILLAPAFAFGRQFLASLPPDTLSTWRHRGWLEFYHYSEQCPRRLTVDFLDDTARYEDIPDVRVPTLVFHGRRDTVVDPGLSKTFAASGPGVELVMLDSDHELRDVLEPMWERMRRFLSLGPAHPDSA